MVRRSAKVFGGERAGMKIIQQLENGDMASIVCLCSYRDLRSELEHQLSYKGKEGVLSIPGWSAPSSIQSRTQYSH
jgi:hypothetical protein